MEKRGAIELSVTTIVVVVIGITLLTLGLVWVGGIFDRLRGTTGGAFEKADAQISEILTGTGSDNPFIISPTRIELEQGDSATATAVVSNLVGGTLSNAKVKRTTSNTKSFYGGSSAGTQDVICYMGDSISHTSNGYSIADGFEVRYPIFIEVKRNAPLGVYACPFEVVTTGNVITGTVPLMIVVKK